MPAWGNGMRESNTLEEKHSRFDKSHYLNTLWACGHFYNILQHRIRHALRPMNLPRPD